MLLPSRVCILYACTAPASWSIAKPLHPRSVTCPRLSKTSVRCACVARMYTQQDRRVQYMQLAEKIPSPLLHSDGRLFRLFEVFWLNFSSRTSRTRRRNSWGKRNNPLSFVHIRTSDAELWPKGLRGGHSVRIHRTRHIVHLSSKCWRIFLAGQFWILGLGQTERCGAGGKGGRKAFNNLRRILSKIQQ